VISARGRDRVRQAPSLNVVCSCMFEDAELSVWPRDFLGFMIHYEGSIPSDLDGGRNGYVVLLRLWNDAHD
jgi:hypothetical protein